MSSAENPSSSAESPSSSAENPSPAAETPEVWDGELPDVWDGPTEEEAGEKPGEGQAAAPSSLNELYADRPQDAPRAAGPPKTRPSREEPPPPITVFMSHVVVPAATITMVSAFLFFLYDVRAVYLPGSFMLKWVGVCFASATVLIARYARMHGKLDGQTSFYTVALAVATTFTLWMTPWDAGAGALGALSNAVIIFLVWKFATALTEQLSADLDHPPPPPQKLYGLERLEMETWRRNNKENRASIYDIGRVKHDPAKIRVDGAAASRAVARLAVLALGVFALCEPVLLAGAPQIAGRALADMIVFLLAAGVVVAAAAAVHDQQRLRSLGVTRRAGGGLEGRLGLAALLMVAVLAVALGMPGVESEGRGEIVQRAAGDGVTTEGGDPPDSGGEQSTEPGDDAAGEGQQAQDGGGETAEHRQSSRGSGRGPSWVAELAGLGKWLRWPLLAALALGGLYGLWRFAPHLAAALRGGFGAWWPRLTAWLKRGKPPKAEKAAHPLAGAADLAGAEPQETVLRAYGIWLEVCRHLGNPRPEGQTPLEFLAALPRHLAELRPAGERLTRLYLTAAYADGSVQATAAHTARGAVDELSILVKKLEKS